jgi:peptidoglycan/xylan/chitin deacetylase (PgdA/CDA1 family)
MIDGLPLLAWPLHRQLLTILIYHRVLPEHDPLRPGEITAEHFEHQVDFLSRYFNVLPLREAVQRLRAGRLPRRACCITFDDGYADNLTVALPILEKYRLPATVFVATGYLDGGRMFNDAVIDAIAGATGQAMNLESIGLGRHAIGSVAEKRMAIATILETLKYQPPEERAVLVDKLVGLAGCGPLPADIMLTSEQVGELARRGVEIGGHTVAHTILTTLEAAAARQEIVAGKQRLEEITGKPVSTFAYPNGRPNRDYQACHVAIVRELGFELAVSTSHGVANPVTDIHQLPRFVPWGDSLTMLAARLMRNAWTGKAAMIC